MGEKVLFVDDEPNVLQSIRRSLHKRFDLSTAESGEVALSMLKAEPEYAVVVSDMRMPSMNGVEFLAKTKTVSPNSVRMMLTGNADQQTAVDAVNHGDIFRFLNKPCKTDVMSAALTAALRQHQLITAEKELLENTLRGSIKALADVMSLTNPEVFGHTTRLKDRVRHVAECMELEDFWKLETTAMLSQIGCVTVSKDLVKRQMAGHTLPDEELAEFSEHAAIGADLLKAIPRMEDIAQSIRYQNKCYDGSGYPLDEVKGADLPLGARVLKLVLDFDALESSGASASAVLSRIKNQAHMYDPDILEAMEKTLERDPTLVATTIAISKLTDDMVLAEDIRTFADVLLVAKGQEATVTVRRHLDNYLANGQIGNSVAVWKDLQQMDEHGQSLGPNA